MAEIVVVTASTGSLPGLTTALRAIPILVEERPLMSFAEPEDWAPVDRALGRLNGYRAVAFTSPRAVRALVGRLRGQGISWPRGESSPLVWAGGPATKRALQGVLGTVRRPVDSATARWGAAGALGRAMLEAGTGSPVLFPCGETRREELAHSLRAGGVEVDEVVCYRSVLASEGTARAAAMRGTVLVVTSPRVAELLAAACPPGGRPDLVAVGPTTAQSAREAGWAPAAAAESPTAEAVSAAVQSAVAQRCA
jgi:uroporphyrinogen III methyltransferase/synthase